MEGLRHRKKQAAEFAHLLKELGYASGTTARAQDWEWLFDYPSTRPFLHHLTTTLTRSNVLTAEEVSQWRSIPAKDYKTGEELQEQLLRLERLEDDAQQELETEALRNEVNAMEAELLRLQYQLTNMEARRDKMQALPENSRPSALVIQMRTQQQLEAVAKIEQHVAREQEEMGNALNEVVKTTTSIFLELEEQLIADSEEDKENNVPVPLNVHSQINPTKVDSYTTLHNIKLDGYMAIEESLTHKLQSLMDLVNRKTAHNNDRNSGSVVTAISNCDSAYAQLSIEVQRLKTVFPISEGKYADALLELSRTRGSFAALQTLNTARYVNMPDVAVKQRITEIEGAVAKIDAAILRHQRKTLPQLWRTLSTLKVLPVLHADYDAKLERQERRNQLLDKAAAFLMGQEARYRLLQGAIQQERENQRKIYGLMSSLLRELRDYAHILRLSLNAHAEFNDSFSRDIVYDQILHTTTTRVEQILDCSATNFGQASESPVDSSSATEQKNQLTIAQAMQKDLYQARASALQAIERQVEEICAVASDDDEVSLTPLVVKQSLEKLENTLRELQTAVDGVCGDHKMKLMALQHNAKEAAVERELFERFFTDCYVPL